MCCEEMPRTRSQHILPEDHCTHLYSAAAICHLYAKGEPLFISWMHHTQFCCVQYQKVQKGIHQGYMVSGPARHGELLPVFTMVNWAPTTCSNTKSKLPHPKTPTTNCDTMASKYIQQQELAGASKSQCWHPKIIC